MLSCVIVDRSWRIITWTGLMFVHINYSENSEWPTLCSLYMKPSTVKYIYITISLENNQLEEYKYTSLQQQPFKLHRTSSGTGKVINISCATGGLHVGTMIRVVWKAQLHCASGKVLHKTKWMRRVRIPTIIRRIQNIYYYFWLAPKRKNRLNKSCKIHVKPNMHVDPTGFLM